MSKMIKINNLASEYQIMRDEILSETDHVLSSGILINGNKTKILEEKIAHICGRQFAFAVGSGTDALIFALRSLRYSHSVKKSKVLIPALSYIATLNSVMEAGFEPVLCDVDPINGLIDFTKIPVTLDEVAAIVFVNLYGNMVNLEKLYSLSILADKQIPIIEDAAQSFGSYYDGRISGGFGDASIFSFDPTKILYASGPAGMVLTDNWEIAEFVEDMRNQGKSTSYNRTGINSRISEIDAAHLLVRLRYVDGWLARRSKAADIYNEELNNVIIPWVADNVIHSYSRYVIQHTDRRNLVEPLAKAGIETSVHYAEPLSFYHGLRGDGSTPNADAFTNNCLTIPVDVDEDQASYIANKINDALSVGNVIEAKPSQN